MKKFDRAFYNKSALKLARDLIGTVIVHNTGKSIRRARIVETEAYVGEHDLACHAAKGRTNRTEVMYGEAGHAYVYLIYGMYNMLNIVASHVDDAQAVLIRAAEPLDGWIADLSGPGKFARDMKILRSHNGLDLVGDVIYVEPGEKKKPRIVRTKRIGIDYAGEWKDELLRFIDADSSAVSRKA